jgi:Beta-propeller repeat
VLRVANGELLQHKPVIYQQVGNARRVVEGRYVIRDGHQVGIEVGAYDTTKPLVIDPVLAFSSYLGGTHADIGERIAVDTKGNAYLTGSTTSPDFPTTNGPAITSALEDVFVAKVNPQGSALVYATYVGGAGSDKGRGIAVDAAGQAYVTGATNSADFPVVNAAQPTPGGLNDAFVIKLNAAGNALIYATYLGGSGADNGAGIAVDRRGSAYITGTTASLDFPTVNAFQPSIAGIDPSTDAFVTKLNPDGLSFAYSTYLGGGEPDSGNAIAVTGNGNAYVTGVTASSDFPTRQPFQPTALRGVSEAFVTKFSRDGASLLYSSNLGGNRSDAGLDIAVDDDSGRAVVVGVTSSTDFPLARPLQSRLNGGASFDGFVTVVNALGTGLVMSTYLGGTGRDEITSVALDAAADMYITGRTFSSDFPLVNAMQTTFGGGSLDAFVAKIDLSRARLVFATYLGGAGDDDGRGVAVDSACGTYAIGTTTSDDFPTTANALQSQRAGDIDAFVAKITGLPCSKDPPH